MNERDYYPDNDYRDYLEHSSGPWKNHKFLFIRNGRYYYPSDVAEGAKSLVRQARMRLTPSYYSAANRERRAYRETGMTKRERDLAKARNDIGKKWAKNRKKETSAGLRGAIGSASTKARTALASLSSKNRERLAYRRTGMTAEQRSAERRKKVDVARQNLQNRLHSAGTNTRIALGNAKAKVRTAKRNVGNAARNAGTRLQPKNINRLIYRNTGVDLGAAASRARNTINSAIDRLKNRKKKRS